MCILFIIHSLRAGSRAASDPVSREAAPVRLVRLSDVHPIDITSYTNVRIY
jgi:hypothetical protein